MTVYIHARSRILRLLVDRSVPIGASCERWARVPASSTIDRPDGAVIDRYRATVQIGKHETAQGAFNRLKDRLFTYDVFPPGLIHFALCPPGTLTEGSTVVQRVVFGQVALEMAVRVFATWDRQV